MQQKLNTIYNILALGTVLYRNILQEYTIIASSRAVKYVLCDL